MGLVDHAREELKRAGYNVDFNKDTISSDSEYADAVAKSVLELLELFASQGHSGMSAAFTLNIFNQLARHKALSELTNKEDEWEDVSAMSNEPTWQSKRQSSCFTHDRKYYYDIDDPDNNIYEVDDEGKATGYATLKPRAERKLVAIKEV